MTTVAPSSAQLKTLTHVQGLLLPLQMFAITAVGTALLTLSAITWRNVTMAELATETDAALLVPWRMGMNVLEPTTQPRTQIIASLYAVMEDLT